VSAIITVWATGHYNFTYTNPMWVFVADDSKIEIYDYDKNELCDWCEDYQGDEYEV